MKQLEASRRLLKVQVPPEEIAIAYDEVYKQIQKEAVIPGFRKGNAPRNLIENQYRDYARKRVTEFLVEESYHHAMSQAGLYAVASPRIENINFPEGGALSFDATVEIKPQITLKDYKSLKVKRKDVRVTDEELNNALENMRELGAQYKTVAPRPIKEGDFILCDLEWKVDATSIDKKTMVLLPVEKKTLTPDVFNGILGGAVGEKIAVSINIDKNFHKPGYVGKTGVLEIAIHEIKEKSLPALDDEFAKDLGPFENIKNLKEKMHEHISLQKQRSARLDMEGQIIEQLLRLHTFELPQSVVENETKSLLKDAKARLSQQGHDEKAVDEAKLRLHAERQVKAFFILEAIAEKESLHAGEKELEGFIQNLAAGQGKSPQNLREQLEKEDRINSLYWQLTEAKVMQFLLDNARVEEEKFGGVK
jgi:trigger factor